MGKIKEFSLWNKFGEESIVQARSRKEAKEILKREERKVKKLI